MFHAPWCETCKELDVNFTKISKNYEKNNLNFAKFDCDKYFSTCEKSQKIKAFPTLKLFLSLEKEVKYSGDKTYEDLEKFLDSLLNPVIKTDMLTPNSLTYVGK